MKKAFLVKKIVSAFCVTFAFSPLIANASNDEAYKVNNIKILDSDGLKEFDTYLDACAKGTKLQGVRKTREIIVSGASQMNDVEKTYYYFLPGTTYLGANIYRAEFLSGDGTGMLTFSLINPPSDFIAKYQKAIGKTKWKKLPEFPYDLELGQLTDADPSRENIFVEDKGADDEFFARKIMEVNTTDLTGNKYVILHCAVPF